MFGDLEHPEGYSSSSFEQRIAMEPVKLLKHCLSTVKLSAEPELRALVDVMAL
jgi:hypothetical protein